MPEEAIEREVQELHKFFEDWFTARVEKTDEAYSRFRAVLADAFFIVFPDGRLLERDEVLASVWDQHGRNSENPRYFRIWVDDVRVRNAAPTAIVVSYREWHEDQGTISARRSTAMLRSRSGGPNGLEWLHTHETWLPGDETHIRSEG